VPRHPCAASDPPAVLLSHFPSIVNSQVSQASIRRRRRFSHGQTDFGEDVRLGDASKAVCWWKPAGSSVYRVVYGDLSIRDVAPGDLPPIPWLAEQK